MNKFFLYVLILFNLIESNMVFSMHKNPFSYDLGIKLIDKNTHKSELTLCCHGYGHSNEIVDVINAINIFDHTLVGFNFPDYGITDESDHTKVAYGTIDEVLPLLFLLKFYACEQEIETINLYGFSAGAGAIINALSILNQYSHQEKLQHVGITHEHAQKIVTALAKGVIILECPLKSMQEIIDFRGATQNLTLIASNYNRNNLNPIDVIPLLKGLTLTFFVHFAKPDEVTSNRDDQIFIDRLKSANKGVTYISTTMQSNHAGYHPELWQSYREYKNS
ncbi:MAG: hypothetical protein AB7R69_00860 [Candidatus Babeliales bacterium]